MITDEDRALVATITFMRALNQEWLKQQLGRPMKESPVPNWQEVAPADRQRLLRSMKTALAATKTENVLKVIENAKAL
ncbi:hypothetical protein IVB12_15760 [Bradyrhizobium sp. 179]|uniref:hypothetical protein n=1 Tax=Bradyrhizobium sp. 179 TaxID=2782648 RepID=UPI001FFA5758|nr:hypothetical protein [Bradyrhizobium sp. 179]MCK1543372.1 hypothetical protein [Bradyrhizobium sp. 179]